MDERIVTVVSGLPRTGTSLMMQMIEAGGIPPLTDEVRRPDEDNPRGYYEYEAVKRTADDPSWLEQAEGRVVKMVHVLLADLPPGYRYRVVFTERSLEEVVRSQNRMLERLGQSLGTLSSEQVMAHFQKQLDRVRAWLADQPNFDVLRVNYNELVRDPAPVVRAVNQFLGGGLDTEAMARVVDPALYRQRET